ncbi:hypothetical protein PHAVU_010G025500 [Phaseolus vulgaris]|uniref:disease resistance protein RUN1-like isoform X2 n=1 Tax=Phaseolus vulgaris TaxID=3885 RepID=UPI0035CC3ABA
MFCPFITKSSHLMFVFRWVILVKPSKQLLSKHSQDNNWSMACGGGATHSPKLQIYLDGMRAITVGLQSRVEDVIRTIKNKSTQVFTIAICGMEGSGKTTIAKAIYHQIHGSFQEKSFIEDIAQVSRTRGDVHLQGQLLSDFLKTKVEIDSVEMGTSMIRERLAGKRVLIVLDDVNLYCPLLLDLWESRAWFGEGTVIIITTIDEDLLRIHQVDSVIRIKLMNANESLELLSWHAFREAKPKEEYHFLAERVVTYCGGLSLALEVIGTYLHERTKKEWTTVLLRLDNISQHDLQRKLKISFDGLRNEIVKDLFLDVCCFFVGKGRAYVTKILSRCGADADSGIRLLIERSLIQVKNNNKLGMHSLLREMGREIIREISRQDSGKNSRRWIDEDAGYVLTDTTGTEAIDGLFVKLRSSKSRLLRQDQIQLAGNYVHRYKNLRWISLHGFSSEYLPNHFYLHDAVAIDLKHSLLQFVWKEAKVLRWLKVLNLSHSVYLTETPDFSGLPSLEQIILKDCPRLREVHQSIGCLCNLILLNLKDCTSLNTLPREIYKLKSLNTLILSGCSKIEILEKDIVQMESLITLISENITVKQVPFSIVSSKCIGYISPREFEGLSHNIFSSIIRSWMSPTINPLSYIHFCTDMEDNSWDDIAPLLSSLANLRSVLVLCDSQFQLSKQVETILIDYGLSTTESGISKEHLRSSVIGLGRYNEFFNTASNSISEASRSSDSSEVSLPGDNDPYWLSHKGEGHSVSFTVAGDREMKGMALWVVYFSNHEIIEPECLDSVLIVNYTKCTCLIHNRWTVISFNDEDWHGIMSNLGYGDKVEIFVTFGYGSVVKNTAVYLIYGESNDFEREPTKEKFPH